MLRNKVYSLINLLGLAIGMAATILILLYVGYETSYDTYHKDAERIYRVSRAWYNEDGEINLHLGQVAPPFGPLLKNDFPGIIERSVRVLNYNPLITYEDKKIEEPHFYFADPDIFKMFSWKLTKGDPNTVLSLPNSIVLSETTARRYFGDSNPVGHIMNMDNQFELKVTGVYEDIPANSHFHADFFAPMKMVEAYYGGPEKFMRAWGSNNFSTYLLVKKGYDVHQLQAQMGKFLDNHLQPSESGRMPSEYNKLTLWPLTSIHLDSHLDSELEANGDRGYIRLYTIIALFILVIASINFVNLSTARSAKRAREVGMRKTMGAGKFMLIRQFLVESIIYSIFSLFLAIILVELILPWFNNFAQVTLSLDILNNGIILILMVSIALVTGLLAGAFPAFYLSGFKPVDSMKGDRHMARSKVDFRSVLVVLQFAIAISLLIGVGVVNDQLTFVKTKPLGFDDKDVLVLPTSQNIMDNYASVKENLLQQTGIKKVGFASRIPSGRLLDSQGATAEVAGQMTPINFRIADVHTDHTFLQTLDIPLVAGRYFDKDKASDSTEAFIINEAAVKAIGWHSNDEAIDKKFNYGNRSGYIIGVTKDFHFESLHQKIAPIVFLITSGRGGQLALKLDHAKRKATINWLKERWSYLRAGFPFTYFFIDVQFNDQYQNEEKLSQLVSYFSLLAVVVGILGLLGLASFTAEQRFKEIGIRKVMGASVSEILLLLTKGYTWLVLIGFVIAIPLSYYFMDKWLNTFAYHGSVSILTIALAGSLAIVLAWLTVGFQTFKAAKANPIESIQYE